MYQFLPAFGLVQRGERVDAAEGGEAEREHFGGGVQLHGARAEGNHRVGQRDVFALQAFDVAHHFCLGVVEAEDVVRQVGGGALQCFGQAAGGGQFAGRGCLCLAQGFGEDAQQGAEGDPVGGLVDAQTDGAVGQVEQVGVVCQGYGAHPFGVGAVGQADVQGVEEVRIQLAASPGFERVGHEGSRLVDAQGDVADAFGAVPYGVHAGHRGQQGLGGTDVRGGFFALDVLFARLERHAVAEVSVLVFAPADDASRHVALVFVACGEVGSRRPSVEQWRAQALGAAEDDVRAPFARRRQQGQAEDVGGDGHLAAGFVGLGDEGAVVADGAVGIGVLEDAGEEVGRELQLFVAAHAQGDALWHGAGAHHGQRLREDAFVDEDGVGAGFLLVAGAQGVHHGDGFGCGGAFVQQRAVGQGHAGEVAHGGLEVHQCFQAALRHFGLVGGVGGVPHGIFEHVALDDGGRDGVIPAAADVGGVHFVLGGQRGDVAGKLVLVHGFG